MKKNYMVVLLAIVAGCFLQMQAQQCFTPAYPSGNMILDPGFDSTSISTGGYGGWGGGRGISKSATSTFCGGTSAYVLGNCGGSIDRGIALKPLTKYRIRAMVKATAEAGKNFQIQVEGIDGSSSKYIYIGNTTGWKQIDTTFISGATVGSTKGIYINSCSGGASPAATDTAFIDNYEMYAVPDVYASPSSLTFLGAGTQKVAVRAENISQDITITAPDGFSVSKATMLSTVSGAKTDSLAVTFAGGTSASGYVYFTSGSVKDSLQVTGTVAPSILASVSNLIFDDLNTTASIVVNGGNLVSDITLTAPTGITVNPASIPFASASNITVNVTYDGTTSNVTGNIVLTSGTTTKSLAVVATKNTDCFSPLYTTLTNMIPSPQLNTLTGFGGWGFKAIVAGEAYCGKNCVKFTAQTNGYPNGAALDVTNIPWIANHTYRFSAMVKAVDGSFAFLANGTSPNVLVSVPMSGDNWVKVDSTFTVGTSPSTSFFTFNNVDGASTGKIAYIDNYELYDITSLLTSVNQVSKNTFSVYASDKKIVAKFDLESASDVTLSVYNVSGMLLESKRAVCAAGTNMKTLNSVLPSGVYMVKMSVNGKLLINKIIL